MLIAYIKEKSVTPFPKTETYKTYLTQSKSIKYSVCYIRSMIGAPATDAFEPFISWPLPLPMFNYWDLSDICQPRQVTDTTRVDPWYSMTVWVSSKKLMVCICD